MSERFLIQNSFKSKTCPERRRKSRIWRVFGRFGTSKTAILVGRTCQLPRHWLFSSAAAAIADTSAVLSGGPRRAMLAAEEGRL